MRLLRSMTTIGFFTIGSRAVGFLREMLMASLLGAGAVSDAFVVALKLPSLFRRILAEGAMNAAFVPLFSGLLATKGEREARSFAEEILAILTLILCVLVLLFEVFLPVIMPYLVPGFRGTPERMALVIEFSRITFPFIFLISLTALYSGILNSYEKFAAVASSPMMGNMAVIITVYGLVWGMHWQGGHAFATGILMCGVVQLAWVVIPLARRGIRLSWRKPTWSSPDVGKFFKLMAPALAGSGIVQFSIFIDTLIASLLPEGGISYIHYADRLSQLPLSVLGTAVGTALLPVLSKKMRSGDIEGAHVNQNLALEYTLLLTLPATLGLMLLAEPLVKLTYEYHAFSPEDTRATAKTLAVLAAGLPGYVLIKIFTTTFFAREDTKTPVFIGVFSVFLNIVISLCLLKTLQYVGIALATALSSWVNGLLSGFILWRRGDLRFNARFRRFFPRSLLATTLTFGMLIILKKSLDLGGGEALRNFYFGKVLFLVSAGLLGFFAFASLTGALNLKRVFSNFLKERGFFKKTVCEGLK